jgi:hypothetical protein
MANSLGNRPRLHEPHPHGSVEKAPTRGQMHCQREHSGFTFISRPGYSPYQANAVCA